MPSTTEEKLKKRKEREERTAQVMKLPRGLLDLSQIMTNEQEAQYRRFYMDCQSIRNSQMDADNYKSDGYVTILHGPRDFHHLGLHVPNQPAGARVAEAPGASKAEKVTVNEVINYLGFLGGLRKKAQPSTSHNEDKPNEMPG